MISDLGWRKKKKKKSNTDLDLQIAKTKRENERNAAEKSQFYLLYISAPDIHQCFCGNSKAINFLQPTLIPLQREIMDAYSPFSFLIMQ